MPRKLLWTGAVLFALLILSFGATVVSIRSGLQRYSDAAVTRFPGPRAEALLQVVDCPSCPLEERNHAVWALGQMEEARALPVLAKYFDHRRCDHATRVCQYELRKAIRMIESRERRTSPIGRTIAALHRPWR